MESKKKEQAGADKEVAGTSGRYFRYRDDGKALRYTSLVNVDLAKCTYVHHKPTQVRTGQPRARGNTEKRK